VVPSATQPSGDQLPDGVGVGLGVGVDVDDAW